jgi:hypothetical protein
MPNVHRIATLILAILMTGCATTARDQTIIGGVADFGSTVVGLSAGATELNPLGLIGSTLLKPVVYAYAESLPEADRADAHSVIGGLWTGASISNICTVLVAHPVCFAVGIATGYKVWESHAEEREFWALCKDAQTANPLMTCTFSKPG